ncbi:hypothetical protein Tco_0781973 [Tanacetum coccineum]
MPIILGTPFLTTAKAKIKFDKGSITLKAGRYKIRFIRTLKFPSKIEERIARDLDPIFPTNYVNRRILEWEERIENCQENEMGFNKWRSKVFDDKNLMDRGMIFTSDPWSAKAFINFKPPMLLGITKLPPFTAFIANFFLIISLYMGPTDSEILYKFPRFFGVLVTKLATGGVVNFALNGKRDMIIENLDLEPKIDAMMRDFLEKVLETNGVGSQRHHIVPFGELNGVSIALVAWYYMKKKHKGSHAYFAEYGNCLFSSSTKWGIDSGASDHMTSNSHIFNNFDTHASSSYVTSVDGSISQVLESGNLKTKKIIGRVRKCDGLYVFEPEVLKSLVELSSSSPFEAHYHLGHPSLQSLKKLCHEYSHLSSLNCDSYEFAKHTRVHLSPRENKRAASPFELVHSDV